MAAARCTAGQSRRRGRPSPPRAREAKGFASRRADDGRGRLRSERGARPREPADDRRDRVGDLDLDTRVERNAAGDGFTATLSRDWEIWGPQGGYVASVAL